MVFDRSSGEPRATPANTLPAPEQPSAKVQVAGVHKFWRVLLGFHGYDDHDERDCWGVRRLSLGAGAELKRGVRTLARPKGATGALTLHAAGPQDIGKGGVTL